jgi:hypothetical protein
MRNVYPPPPPPLMIVALNMTRTHHALGNSGGKRRTCMRYDTWRRQLAGVKARQVINRANEKWYAHFIMARDGNFTRSVELVGSRQMKALDQMGRACSRLDGAWRRLPDENFIPLFGLEKDPSTLT